MGAPTRDGGDLGGDSGWGGMDWGGDPWGLGGSAAAGLLEGAVSLNGYEIEVFFSEGSGPTSASAYGLAPIMGAPSTVVDARQTSVSIIITHTGTTLGGFYTLSVSLDTGIESVTLYTKGDMPPFVIQPTDSGEDIVFTFAERMLTAAQGSDIDDPASYGFTSVPDYPIFLTPTRIDHPWTGNAAKVHMTVKGMTSLRYGCKISPALAWNWTGAVLPSEDPTLDGREVNPGQGTSTIAENTMWLSRPIFNVYGWEFLDLSGRLTTTATFRADFEFNAESMICHPPILAFDNPKVGDLIVEDGPGGTRINIQLRQSQNEDWLRIWSGTFNTFIRQPWSIGTNVITVIRNTKAGIWAFLFNGTPFLSVLLADLDGPAEGDAPGVIWKFVGDEWFSLEAFNLRNVKVTASSTVWSGSWNFLHESMSNFTGSAILARDHVMTRRGPLVKDWGDATPATKADVSVLVCGVPVGVADVNPFIGKIIPDIPIPMMPLGDPLGDVKLDYYWQASPVMGMVLNMPGLVMGQWDRKDIGPHYPVEHGQPYTAWVENGVLEGFIIPEPAHDFPKCRVCGSDLVDLGPPFWWCVNPTCANFHVKLIPSWEDLNPVRFPMGTVLGPVSRPDPLHIGHRYIGFQREYSALLGSPTTLLLGVNPMASSVDNFKRDVQGISFVYDGTAAPNLSDPVWSLTGTDSGHLDVGEGTWTLVDADPGPWTPVDPAVALWGKEIDLTFPAAITVVTRFQIEDADNLFGTDANILQPDGVFTGVGFGVHDNHRLWLAGTLLVNGLQHVGMLLDARRIHFLDGWYVGPLAVTTFDDRNTFRWTTADAPSDFQAGRRFQILSGPQMGVWTASTVLRHCDGTMTVTVDTPLPADPTRWGCGSATVVFETPWSGKPSTYRLVVDSDQDVATLSLSGATTAIIATLDGQTATVPIPAETSLILDLTGKGQVFWGSLSTLATNRSKWSFVQTGVAPDFSTLSAGSVRVATEMSDLPEDDPNNPWFVTQGFGDDHVISAGNLAMKSIVSSETLDTTFGWTRIEPFLAGDARVDARAMFRVDSGTASSGDAQIVINNGSKEVRLATLVYAEGFTGTEYRQLVSMPSVSASGIMDPAVQGWTIVPGSAGTSSSDEWDLTVTAGSGVSRRWFANLDATSLGALDSGWRIFEMQVAVDSFTPDGSGNVGIGLDADIDTTHALGIRLKSPGKVQLVDDTGTSVQEWTFDWEDGDFHSFRASAISGVVSLAIDDVIQTPTLTTASFLGGSGGNLCVFGVSSPSGASSVTRWRATAFSCVPGASCHRTFGIWKGGDVGYLNSWEIPRTDDTTAPNSAEFGPVVQDMDWQAGPVETRLLFAPDWGVTFYRPDLPLPPYYQPESGTPGTGFANQMNEPSAGWINVEWPDIPLVPSTFGFVSFGALENESSTRQRWNWVRYRIFKALLEDHIAPQHMVIGQAGVTTSGEITKDVEQEVVIVQTLTAQSLTLLPTNLNAASIWKVIDGARILTQESWTFDIGLQILTLNDGILFSSEHAAVTVVFIPGLPNTKTYLQVQPLLDSITLLNEGTPPVPQSQTMASEKEIVYGSLLGDPNAPLGGILLLNDPYRVLKLKNDPSSLYENLEFIQVTNGGFSGGIAIAGEGMIGQGFSGWSNAKEDIPSGLSAEGDDVIYEPSGAGSVGSIGCEGEIPGFKGSTPLCPTDEVVGRAVGAHVMDFRGTMFWQENKTPAREDFEQGAGMPGCFLYASGGSYMGPVVDSQGQIIGSAPLGGHIGPGCAVLMPNFPSNNVVAGRDGGKVHRRTEWVMQLRSVSRIVANSVGGYTVVDIPLRETVQWPGADNVPPSRPSSWRDNPSGLPNPNGRGAVLMVMTGAGDYSHVGPWGGLGSLTPTPDSGFFEFDPAALQDGDQVAVEKEPGGISILFTARTVPTAPREFAIAPSPHVNLANVINTDPVAGALVTATAGLTWTGVPSVLVESVLPVTATNMVTIWSGNVAAIWLVGVINEPAGRGLLTGGAKITQSSLIAGGYSTVPGGFHDPKLGFVCLGGTVLPVGLETVRIVYSP